MPNLDRDHVIMYGDKGVEFTLPTGWEATVLSCLKHIGKMDNLEGQLEAKLASRLEDFDLNEGKIVVVTDDNTRVTPVKDLLPTVLRTLESHGAKSENIDIIVGTGTHEPLTESQLTEKLGDIDKLKVYNHDAYRELVNLGQTSQGTPLWVNRRVAEAKLKIGIGSVIPHFFAGYTGGPKTVLPAVAGMETIFKNHLKVNENNAVLGRLAGNPVWEEMAESLHMTAFQLKVEAVLNEKNEVTALTVSDPISAQAECVEKVKGIYGVSFREKVDVCITTGHPFDKVLFQAVKGVYPADLITRDGGTIIFAASCSGGVGFQEFYEMMLMTPDPEAFHRIMARGEVSVNGSTMAYRLKLAIARKQVLFVSDLEKHELSYAGMTHVNSLEEAIKIARRRLPDAKVAIFPCGAETLPLPA